MRKLGMIAATAAVLMTAVTGCKSSDTSSDCEWELDAYSVSAMAKPKPGGGHSFRKVRPHTNRGSGHSRPQLKPHKPHKAPKGKHWEWDCD